MTESEMNNDKQDLYKALYLKRRTESFEKYKNYPILYWTVRFHRNTRNERMVFRNRPYLLSLYKNIHKYEKVAIEKSVQCGISELCIAESHKLAADGLMVFYVLPKYEIRNRFVSNRIVRLHSRSGYYANLVRAAKAEGGTHRTSLMHFGKGSIAYAGSNVEDEFIEIPVDISYVDEKDRCNQKNLLLIPDRLTASDFKYQREVSNPTVQGFGIDARYESSSKGVWMLKCPGCGKWFEPKFFEHVVRRVGQNRYEVIDKDYVEGINEPRVIHNCGAAVDRLSSGEWVHEFVSKRWVGFRISKLINVYSPVSEVVQHWNDAIGNSTKEQIVYNSDLGLPYTSKGAKITREDLELCRREYTYPGMAASLKSIRVVGIDVGSVLNLVIRERVQDRGIIAYRLLLAQTVNTFAELKKILKEWKARVVVIDAYPEIHEVSKLKAEFNNVWSSRFQEKRIELSINKRERIMTMDRTSLLDMVKAAIVDEQAFLLPKDAENIDHGDYYSQMLASTRILDVDEKNPENSRYVWRETTADHYFLAEAYCMQGIIMLPKYSVFDFMNSEIASIEKKEKKGSAIVPTTGNPVLDAADRHYTMKPSIVTKSAESVKKEILSIIPSCMDKGRVDLKKFQRASGLVGENAEKFLLEEGYAKQSGFFIKKSKEENS